MTKIDGSKWFFAGSDPALFADPDVKRLVDEALGVAPPGYLGADAVQLLPRSKVTAPCRLCGGIEVLTKEHVPPRSSGNKVSFSSHAYEEWLRQKQLEVPEQQRVFQGGIFGYTLCEGCNSLTGHRYGDEYKRWAAATLGAMAAMPPPEVLDQRSEPFAWDLQLGSKESGGVRPGAMVRQVLSLMCSLSGTWDLAGTFPELRRIILEQATECLDHQLALGAFLYLGPNLRMKGPQLRLNPALRAWKWIMEMAFPPFAFVLVVASSHPDPGEGLLMTDWVKFPPTEEVAFEGTLEVGFGWSPYPADYRSRSQMMTEAGLAPEDAGGGVIG